jgi:hypothetical protein
MGSVLPDLAAWHELLKVIRTGILAMVKVFRNKEVSRSGRTKKLGG